MIGTQQIVAIQRGFWRKQRQKRGGRQQRVELNEADVAVDAPMDELLSVNEALELLAESDEDAAELVKLRYFAGLTVEEAADIMEISARSAYRIWSYARAWLFRHLQEDGNPS